MARIERFEDIDAWQLARELTGMVYAASRQGCFAQDLRFCSLSTFQPSNLPTF